MNRARLIGIAVAALAVVGAGGVVVAGGQQNSPPQDARPAGDPIGDILRNTPPVETAPAGAPAPAAPVAIVPTAPVDMTGGAPQETVAADAAEAKADEKVPAAEKIQEADTPLPRQRRRVAVIEAIDKITAERMRFEVVVGGRPVRFNDSLIFTARACEVSADNELVSDAIAYLDISLEPKGTTRAHEPRQIFRGWMFASTPGVSGLQHPIYDAWVVGCKA
jgi:hypothetical protein